MGRLDRFKISLWVDVNAVTYRWIELVFNPRNKAEQFVSNTLRFIHPYLAFVTYRFHVEKAREAGKYSPSWPCLTLKLILYRYQN
jgi:hypothetical protein